MFGSNSQDRLFFVHRHLAAVLALAVGIAGCASIRDGVAPLGSQPDAATAAEPGFAPAREVTPSPPVKPLSEAERKRLEAELIEIRDRQEESVAATSSKRPAPQHRHDRSPPRLEPKPSAEAGGSVGRDKE